jgi:hypothetical protein
MLQEFLRRPLHAGELILVFLLEVIFEGEHVLGISLVDRLTLVDLPVQLGLVLQEEVVDLREGRRRLGLPAQLLLLGQGWL